ncbi:MAG: DNA polymerase III subunit delta' [Alphaproteobacteria bacterium]
MARRAALADVVEELPESDQVEGAAHPRHCQKVLGHFGAEQSLLEAWNADKMPHAILLCGPKGIGKASFAYRLARFVLSEGGDAGGAALFTADDIAATSLDVDMQQPAMERISALSHADLKVLRRQWDRDKKRFKANIAVDDVRALAPFFGSTAAEGGWRVAIVDAAEDMNRAAANALLKTLEEPPANTILILVSHAPGRLLPTIRSRCRRVPMSALVQNDFLAALDTVGTKVAPEDQVMLSRLAAGRPGRAIELLGLEGTDLFRQMVRLSCGQDAKARGQFASSLSGIKADAQFRILEDLFSEWLAHLARVSATRQSAHEMLSEEQALLDRGISPLVFGDLAETIRQLFGETIGLNLDKHQMLLRLFDTLDAAWQGR